MNELISVIVPIHKIPKNISLVRDQIHTAVTPFEIIYVINSKLNVNIISYKENERYVQSENIGRGNMMLQGALNAKGDILMFLHSDTLLPDNWDKSVRSALKNKKVIGGGFSLSFDIDHLYLIFMLKFITFMVLLTRILSGDRAIFVRRKPLIKDLSILETPIMEDIELSFWLKKHGKVKLLKDKVITSADAFVTNGFICQSYKIFKSLAWYKLKGNTNQIYQYYYSKEY